MIFVFKDGTGYQEFPKPGPDASPNFEVTGDAERRILAGEVWRLTPDASGVEFPPPEEAEAIVAARELERERRGLNPTRLQVRLALAEEGALAAVDEAVSGSNVETEEMWAAAMKVRRDGPLTDQLKALMGWTDEFVDDLFRVAMTKEP